MPTRSRVVVLSIVGVLLVALAATLTGPVPGGVTSAAGTTAASSTAARGAQSGATSLSAQIVQPGARKARAGNALLTGTVKFNPARKGRPVQIQRRVEGSGKWRTVARKQQDKRGRVSFNGKGYDRGDPYEYRGRALRWKGLKPIAASPESAAAWQLKFNDEFSGRKLQAHWADRKPTHKACAKVGDPRTRKVRKGTLRFSVKLDPAKRNQRCKTSYGKFRYYLNGQISTQHVPVAYSYGTLSARIKFQKGRGQHSSFWLQPLEWNPGADPSVAGAEVDIVEFFGKGYPDGGLASFLYNYGITDGDGDLVKIGGVSRKASRMLPKRDAWWKRFHVFSLQWTPKTYTFLVDGKPHFRTARGVVENAEYMILGLTTSEWELGQAKRLGIKPEGTMYIDWVRVWQER